MTRNMETNLRCMLSDWSHLSSVPLIVSRFSNEGNNGENNHRESDTRGSRDSSPNRRLGRGSFSYCLSPNSEPWANTRPCTSQSPCRHLSRNQCQRATWQTTHQVGPSESSATDHLPNRAVRHREGSRDNPHSCCTGCQRHSAAGSPLLRRVPISAGVRNRNQESQTFHLTSTRECTTIWLWIIWVQPLRPYPIQPAGQ